jgi:hypothetical protein
MNAPGLFDTHEELTVSVGGKPSEPTFKDLLKKIAELLFDHRTYQKWGSDLETRRYRDPREHDPDYGQNLRKVEGDIRQTERDFRMRDYHEGGGDSSWQKWVMTIVQLLIVAGIGGVIYELEELKSTMAASLARQEMDERRLDRIESHLWRGSP